MMCLKRNFLDTVRDHMASDSFEEIWAFIYQS